MLWGGYDAIYHFGRGISAVFYDREATFDVLARHFAETFPQLAGVRLTHRWSGVIDTSLGSVVAGVRQADRIVHEEIFGPVLTVRRGATGYADCWTLNLVDSFSWKRQ